MKMANKFGGRNWNKKIWKWSFSILFFISVLVLFRTFCFDIYYVPSASMEPTIYPGDIVLVSKLSYGPRLNGFNNIRLGDINNVKRFDVIIFNYPLGDTIYEHDPNIDYYKAKAGKCINDLSDSIVYLPVKYRQIYIKRCIGLPGDTFSMEQRKIYINRRLVCVPETIIEGKSKTKQPKEYNWRRQPLESSNKGFWKEANTYRIVFPNNYVFHWNHDIFGPVIIPKKGMTIKLNLENIWLYKRAIECYEYNNLKINQSGVYINGIKCNSYTFQMNYFFMIGDNRLNSIDSMFWGFVPEDHIIGKMIGILLPIR